MEDNFNPDNFEEFLQEQVGNQRMYPSDAVWRDINKKLHGEKRWPALTIAAFLLLSVTVGICVHFTPKSSIFLKPGLEPISISKQPVTSDDVLNKLTSSAPFANNNNNNQVTGSAPNIGNTDEVAEQTTNSSITDPATVNIPNENIALEQKATSRSSSAYYTGRVENYSGKDEKLVLNKTETSLVQETVNEEGLIKSTVEEASPIAQITPPSRAIVSPGEFKKDYNDKNMVDEFLKDHKNDITLYTVTKPETVKHKFGYLVYIAPSFSYRKLAEDKSIIRDNVSGPVGINYVTDVNKVVRHKPGTGIEAGLSIYYNLSNKVRVKSGLQFNVRQYSIDAFRSYSEIASIALVGANRIDTVNTIAVYRNNNGYLATELVNRYYQVAVPMGLEWEVLGNRKVQLNVAASIQPTYLINKNAYLLSTNFKNYTENPDMVRRWNLNSNLEAFLSYQVGKIKWQVGPQIRYQPYSTFIAEYPIKEHLLDYGVKLGVSKNF
jgi:hypothetical protein